LIKIEVAWRCLKEIFSMSFSNFHLPLFEKILNSTPCAFLFRERMVSLQQYNSVGNVFQLDQKGFSCFSLLTQLLTISSLSFFIYRLGLPQFLYQCWNVPLFRMPLKLREGIVQTQIVFLSKCALRLNQMHLPLITDVDIKTNNCHKYHSDVWLPAHPWYLCLLLETQITHQQQGVLFQKLVVV
jgi:hypothetical protein